MRVDRALCTENASECILVRIIFFWMIDAIWICVFVHATLISLHLIRLPIVRVVDALSRARR